MNRTFTPDLDAGVLKRLEDYAALFRGDFKQASQAGWCGVYLSGLMQDGERKSMEPVSRRVTLPPGLQVKDPEQALQQFISQSPWEEQALLRRYREIMAQTFADPNGIFVLDDTSFPKAGTHSVGVQRQYCGALGKRANCQCAVSLHYVSAAGHIPLEMRLFLPDVWLEDPERLKRAGVPEDKQHAQTKGEIALELLDRVRSEGAFSGGLVIADAGYGVSGPLRDGLSARGLHWIMGVSREMSVFAQEPRWERPAESAKGRPRLRARLAAGSPQPVSVEELQKQTKLAKVTWREGTKGAMSGRFAWIRVWSAHRWNNGECADKEPLWLLIEEQPGGVIKYAFSNLPPDTPRLKAVRLWRERWKIEQGYQQMKEELGLDHFEGRGWRGFHHHCALVMLAFGFLALEQRRAVQARGRSKKKARSPAGFR
jgi:SRSO17 transposase